MNLVDLASSRFGGEVVSCTDEFFADAANLLTPAAPLWKEGAFTEHGKWMDGWETRRRRDEGYDSCVIRLGLPGIVRSVTVDTAHFTGNYPESFSLEACGVAPGNLAEAEWVEIVARSALTGDSVATFDIADPHRVTHLRLNIYPDGGIARLRVDGEPVPAHDQVCPDSGRVDLALATVGGVGVEASDAHYASPANLVSPTEPEGMWDGWETARRRGPGHDWAVVRLGLPGTLEAIDVDTRHFKGNSPGWVTLDVTRDGRDWDEALPRTPVSPDQVNHIQLDHPVEAARVRLNIHPDGGVARLRVWGRPQTDTAAAIRLRYLDSLFPQEARRFFGGACRATEWVEAMTGSRPYGNADLVMEIAERCFNTLSRQGWTEAFAAHPRIGESRGNQAEEGETHSRLEQAGVADRLADELTSINLRYEEAFDHTYIVRAADRTGEELLALARERLHNDPETEWGVAAVQQREITALRLRRMLCLPEEET